jgi:hypothetical protein
MSDRGRRVAKSRPAFCEPELMRVEVIVLNVPLVSAEGSATHTSLRKMGERRAPICRSRFTARHSTTTRPVAKELRGHLKSINKCDNLISHFVATPQAFCELRLRDIGEVAEPSA